MISKKKDPNPTVAIPSWITYLILIGSWVQFQDWKKKTKNQIPAPTQKTTST